MARSKYIYHHKINGKEVSKDEFLERLGNHNLHIEYAGIIAVSTVDERKVKREYNAMRNQKARASIYVNDDTCKSEMFEIRREEKL